MQAAVRTNHDPAGPANTGCYIFGAMRNTEQLLLLLQTLYACQPIQLLTHALLVHCHLLHILCLFSAVSTFQQQ
jgi:hypothetical protein